MRVELQREDNAPGSSPHDSLRLDNEYSIQVGDFKVLESGTELGISINTDGNLDRGFFSITKNPEHQNAVIFKSEADPNQVFDAFPVIIKDISFYRNEKTLKVVKATAKSLKFANIAASLASVYFSPTVAL